MTIRRIDDHTVNMCINVGEKVLCINRTHIVGAYGTAASRPAAFTPIIDQSDRAYVSLEAFGLASGCVCRRPDECDCAASGDIAHALGSGTDKLFILNLMHWLGGALPD